jgi:hypothetical protein
MLKLAISPSASALLRGLLDRAGLPRDRILLSHVRSVDWQSLTFVGERHEFQLRIPGPGSGLMAERLCAGLEDAEFDVPGQVRRRHCCPRRRAAAATRRRRADRHRSPDHRGLSDRS